MKLLNCAPLLALIVSGLAVSAPASAGSLSLSPAALSATNGTLRASLLMGDIAITAAPSNQQQQQQQVRNLLTGDAGIVYGAPLSGFDI